MSDIIVSRDETEEETFTPEISDETLEAAAGTAGAPSPALSLNFSSYHLHCC
jgi:hypothetical protein